MRRLFSLVVLGFYAGSGAGVLNHFFGPWGGAFGIALGVLVGLHCGTEAAKAMAWDTYSRRGFFAEGDRYGR